MDPCRTASIRRTATLALLLGFSLAHAACPGPDPQFLDGGSDYTLLRDSLTCLPDNNGEIEQDELIFRASLAATYRVNPPGTLETFDPTGYSLDGKLQWDFTSQKGSILSVKVEPVQGTWFASYFPGGEVALPTTVAADTLQVLASESGKVLLLGLASRKPDTTLMVYDPPVVALRFPLKPGQQFSSTSEVKAGAKLNGLSIATKDTYEVAVTTEGVLHLPSLKLHRTLRVETLVTSKAVGGVTATTRQLQWFSECYGEVVHALSKTNEPKALFTQAVELRRLSF